MYTLTGITRTYRQGKRTITALREVELVVEDGDWLALQGRTGSGKTTLLQLLGGLDRPGTGTITFDGQDLARLPEARLTEFRATSVGFIFQTFNLLPTLSAVENVEAALVPLKVDATKRRVRAMQALEAVGLGHRAQHVPSELSGGQQQRVGIARALVKEPKVLLADEPTGNLDGDTRNEIIALLNRLWQEHHFTLVLVTHDPSLAAHAQRVGVMSDGQLVMEQEHAAPDERSQQKPDLPLA